MIKYITSNNVEHNLDGHFSVQQTDFNKYKWKVNGTSKRIGERINSIGMEPIEYSGVLTYTGGHPKCEEDLDSVIQAFEFDVANISPGKLVLGDWYINCLITSSSTNEYGENYIKKNVGIYCPYPRWIREKKYSYYKEAEESENEDFLDFPFDFLIDLHSDSNYSSGSIRNELLTPAHFKMVIYGPCVNPLISIAGHVYQVNTVVSADEYLVINSRDEKVYRVTRNGLKINEFNNRNKQSPVFEKIPAGTSSVVWNRSFGFDIVLFQERSEPEWI